MEEHPAGSCASGSGTVEVEAAGSADEGSSKLFLASRHCKSSTYCTETSISPAMQPEMLLLQRFYPCRRRFLFLAWEVNSVVPRLPHREVHL